MKEFVKTMKQTFQVSKEELLGLSGIIVCGGIVGIVVALILMNMGAMDNEYGTMGAMIGMIIGTMLIFILGIFSLQQDFNLAISFGKARKYYVPARFLFMVTNSVFCLLTIVIIGLIEHVLYTTFFAGVVCAFDVIAIMLHPVALVGFLFLVPAITLACGACYLKFGAKCAWFFWVLWIVGCVAFPRILNEASNNLDSGWAKMGRTFISFVKQLTAMQVVAGMVVLGIAALTVAFGVLRKQRVTA